MKYGLVLLTLCTLRAAAQTPGPDSDRVLLPTGWYLSPAGTTLPLTSDLPLNLALSPDGVHAAVTNNGNGKQCIDLVEPGGAKGRIIHSLSARPGWGLPFPKAPLSLCLRRTTTSLGTASRESN